MPAACQGQVPEEVLRVAILKTFSKFSEKHSCRIFFFFEGWRPFLAGKFFGTFLNRCFYCAVWLRYKLCTKDLIVTSQLTFTVKLYKTTTLGTTEKWPSWTGCSFIKHLYETTTNQM